MTTRPKDEDPTWAQAVGGATRIALESGAIEDSEAEQVRAVVERVERLGPKVEGYRRSPDARDQQLLKAVTKPNITGDVIGFMDVIELLPEPHAPRGRKVSFMADWQAAHRRLAEKLGRQPTEHEVADVIGTREWRNIKTESALKTFRRLNRAHR